MSYAPTPDADGIRWYGCWAGNNRGRKENLRQCIVEISDRFSHGYQCTRSRGNGPGGLYCKQHDPDVIKRKRDEERAKWMRIEEIRKRNRDRQQQKADALDACHAAIQQIADGHNDPRQLAYDVLALFPSDDTPGKDAT